MSVDKTKLVQSFVGLTSSVVSCEQEELARQCIGAIRLLSTRYEHIPFQMILQWNQEKPSSIIVRAYELLLLYTTNLLKPKLPQSWRCISTNNSHFCVSVTSMTGARDVLEKIGYTESLPRAVMFPDHVKEPDREKLRVIATELLMAKVETEDLLQSQVVLTQEVVDVRGSLSQHATSPNSSSLEDRSKRRLMRMVEERVSVGCEKAWQMIGKAMESGSLKQRSVVGVVTGVTGSGKTTLLRHLFCVAPNGLYTSRGNAEQLFRGLLHHVVRISASKLQHLSYKNVHEFLAPLIQAGMRESNIESLAARFVYHEDSVDAATCKPASLPSHSLSTTVDVALTSPSTATSLPLQESPSCQDMVPLAISAPSPVEDSLLELVHITDTGDRPELLEAVPSLVHNADLAMVLVDLQYGLNECPPVHLREDGVANQRDTLSRCTGRDIILKLISNLHVKKPLKEAFQLIIIATHRDCVKRDLVTLADALNHELHRLLLPAFQDELTLFETPNKIAFVLNLTNPDSHDKDILELLRREVVKTGLGKIFDTPTSFFIFEQDLLLFAKTVKRDVLSIDECRAVGARLKMSHRVVEAALVMFHRQNTFLYFKNILPSLVFVNPQVPLDIADSIICFSNKKLHCVPAKLVSLLKDSIITEEMLTSVQISPHLKEGICEVRDAIKLLCHTFALAPLQSNTAGGEATGKDKEYLMMGLKPAIPDNQLQCYLPKTSDTVPLVVKFSSGCVPLGCFGRIISCLLSKFGWGVTRKNGIPKCLAHNIVSLHDPDTVVNVVLVDLSQHLEIHVDSDLSFRDSPSDICCTIHSKILHAVNKVLEVICLQGQINVTSAVVCPCLEALEKHFAVFAEHQSQHLLRCECSVSKPNEKQLLWVGDVAKTSNTAQTVLSKRRGPVSQEPPLPQQHHILQKNERVGHQFNSQSLLPFNQPAYQPSFSQPSDQHWPLQAQPSDQHWPLQSPHQDQCTYRNPLVQLSQHPYQATEGQQLPRQTTTSPSKPSSGKPQLSDLTCELRVLAWSDVKDMALQLGLEFATLQDIEQRYSMSSDRLSATMNAWLTRDAKASWKKIVKVLKVIRQTVLAERLSTTAVLSI